MGKELRYHKNAERPSAQLWVFSDVGTLVDFSSGYTWSLKIGDKGSTALLTKTSGITGAAGAGTDPTGTPNIVIAWTAGELNLTPGSYSYQLTPTSGGLDRDPYEGPFIILDTIS